MIVKYYKTAEAIEPYKATKFSSGLDLSSVDEVIIFPKERVLIHTGIHVEIPIGFEGQVRSRSGLSLENGIFVLNSPGTIDSDYIGEIGVILFNTSNLPFIVKKGMRIAQLVITPVMFPTLQLVNKLEDLTKTDRAFGGYGSTGI